MKFNRDYFLIVSCKAAISNVTTISVNKNVEPTQHIMKLNALDCG
jgi:hypothetical protein